VSNLLTPAAPGSEQQDAPLTEEERKLLNRLFSDPTYFPIEFRTWIRSYLETSDIRLPSSAIVGGNAPKVNLPAGTILPFAGDQIPANCLPCNGQSISRDEYKLLFDAINVFWGAVDSDHFNVPDLRDRALYGVGSSVSLAATDGKGAGSRGGPNHYHTISQTTGGGGTHSHSVSGSSDNPGTHTHAARAANFASQGGTQTGASGTARYTTQDPQFDTGGSGAHTHNFSGGTNSAGDHTHTLNGNTSGGYDTKPSYAGVSYCIATGKN
jgi:microcystin-dependent protein